jgi:CRP-like cAMP-binding protein/Fe-S-cluster-containing hydrogenase component 2
MPKEVIIPADLGGAPLTSAELTAIPDFSGIRKETWDKFPGAVARKEYRTGELLMREGESGTTAFYLLSGSVDIYLETPVGRFTAKKRARPRGLLRGVTRLTDYIKGTPPRRAGDESAERSHIPIDSPVDLPLDNPIATLEAGDIIGELAALAALKQDRLKRPKFYPRSATVRARTDVVALEILPNVLNNVLYNAPAFKDKLNQNYRRRALETQLRSVSVFRGLSDEFISTLRDRVELVDVQPGERICKQGDVADAFYLIRLGFVKVSQSFPGGEMVLTYLSRGSYFGEMGLLPPVFRVRAKGQQAGQVAEGAVSDAILTAGRGPRVANSLAVPWDEFISREHFTMRVEGRQVRVSRLATGKNPLTYRMQPSEDFLISPGESFVVGGTTFEFVEDPLQAGRRTATCTAVDYVQLVRIKAPDFTAMTEQFPEVRSAITEVARTRRQMDLQLLGRVQTISLGTFLEQELMQGQNMLLLDLDKCTRCDECVKACVATHEDGVTRLVRDGLRFDHYLVPTSCRACLDPLCMTRCPVGSIRRKGSLDIVIEDWCIGCNNCASDCPYGNINIVQLPAGGSKAQAAETRAKAVVCDLCAEYDEPNCVRACPHDAAIRVEPKTFFARELVGFQLAVAAKIAAPTPAPTGAALEAETRIYSNVDELLSLLPRLRVQSGPRAGSVLQLRYPSTSFGRAPENDYRFDEDSQLSRNHCVITSSSGRFTLRDLSSTNGTRVNGNPITEIELRPGDVIQIGENEMEFNTGQKT